MTGETTMIGAISASSAKHYFWGEACEGWVLLPDDDLLIIQERMPAGTSEVRHVHRRAKQFFFVLEGQLTMEKFGEVVEIFPRQGIQIDPGVPHQARNTTDEDVVFLMISAPSTRGDRVEQSIA